MALVGSGSTPSGGALDAARAHAAVERLLDREATRIVCAGPGSSAIAALLVDEDPRRQCTAVEIERYDAPALTVLRTLRAAPGWTRTGIDAVVVCGELGHWSDPVWLFDGLRAGVRDDGLLVIVTPALGTGLPAGTVRPALARYLADAGWDPTLIEARPDPTRRVARWPDSGRRSVAGGDTVGEVSALELEEHTAMLFVAAAWNSAPAVPVDRSIVLVASTDPAEARRTVAALLADPAGGTPELRTEVIVVAADDSADDLDAFDERVRVIRSRFARDPVAARNAGARAARGSLLLFADADRATPPRWANGLDPAAPDFGATGPVAAVFDPTITPGSVVPRPMTPDDIDPARGTVFDATALAGPALAVPRPTFVTAGGFDETMGSLAEVDLCLRLRMHGRRVVCAPDGEPPASAGDGGSTNAQLRDRRKFLEKWSGQLIADTPRPSAVERPSSLVASPAPVVWTARFFDGGGIADEARALVLALDQSGTDVRADPTHWGEHLLPTTRDLPARLDSLVIPEAPGRFVHVMHGDVVVEPVDPIAPGTQLEPRFRRHPGAVRSIGRVRCDTDVVPPAWIPLLDELDELWVPTPADVERFRIAGIGAERLHVVSGCIERARYERATTRLPLPGAHGFVFLAVCYLDQRKGIDVLLRAYFEEFDARDDVTLVVKLSPAPGRPIADDVAALRAFTRDALGRELGDGPRVVLMTRDLSSDQMLRLFRSVDAYVLPSRGEGWGRPYMEAMASGLPTIATGWGGHLEFMSPDNSYLVGYELEEVPGWPGVRRAEPDGEHLRRRLREVITDHEGARRRGDRARAEVLRDFDVRRAVDQITDRLRDRGTPAARRSSDRRVRYEGPQTGAFGMAVVNRELCRELRAQGVELTVAGDAAALDTPEPDAAAPDQTPTVTVRSAWPPDLSAVPHGRLVLAQPWELGSVPREWVAAVGETVDEVWVPSRFVRDCYLRSGVAPERVHVVPNGVDPVRFSPGAAPLALPTDRRFKFLFVGGTIPRKAADVVVDTYLSTFAPGDDVCLVVKDLGTSSFYRGHGIGDRMQALAADPGHAAIVYLSDDLTDEQLPGLYTACDCLVHPYRGEGFGLPIVEAMACGLPVVVPRYGPALDYCDAATAVLVPAVELWGTDKRVGDRRTVSHPWWAEVDREELARSMRELVEDGERARRIGRRACAHVRNEHTWTLAAERARARLRALGEPPRPRASARTRLSVCMITKDAEALIESSLASVVDVADEIVVIDTGSRDRTVRIAESFGAQVHRRPWHNDFADARNAAIDLAGGSWILMLDADQTLEPASAHELNCLVDAELLWGFLVRQLNYTGRSGDAMVEHPQVRLFPNHPALRFRGRVHEQLVALDSALAFQVVPSGIVLHHHGYRPQYRDALAVAERDRAILEEDVAKDPRDAFAAYNLGMAYRVLGRDGDAEEQLARCVALASVGPGGSFPQFLLHALVELAEVLRAGGRFDESLARAAAAARLDSRRADVQYLLGRVNHALGDVGAAARGYENAIACGPGPALAPTDPSTAGWRPLCGLAEIALANGRGQEAEALLRRALALTRDPHATALIAQLHALIGSV